MLNALKHYIIWCFVKVVGSIFLRKSPPLHLDKNTLDFILRKLSPIIDNYTKREIEFLTTP